VTARESARDFGSYSDKQLRKSLSRLELLYLSLGGIIGSGWLFTSLYAAAYAGSEAVLSWIIGGILAIFIGLTYAEISSAIPKSGGIARYPHYTHGGLVGYLITWSYFLAAASTTSIEVEAVIEYISSYDKSLSSLLTTTGYFNGQQITILTPMGMLVATLLLILFFFINYAGVNVLGKVTHGTGWWKLLVPTITAILLLAFDFHPQNFSISSFSSTSFSTVLYSIPATGVIYSFLGFRQAIEYGGEGKKPEKDIPFAVIGSLVIAIALYSLLQIAFIGGIDWRNLYLNESGKLVPVTPGNWSALTSAVTKNGIAISNGPFYVLLTSTPLTGILALIFLVWSYILILDAIVSPSGTGWIYLGSTARTIYAFATNGYLPEIFLRVGRTKVPTLSLLLSLILGIIFLLPFPSWYALVGFNSLTTVLTYIMGGIGLAVLRKTAPDLKRPFKLSGASIIAPIATVAAGLIIYWSGFVTLFYVLTAIFFGLPLFLTFYANKVLGIKRNLGIVISIVDILANLGLSLYLFYFTNGLTKSNNIAFLIYLTGISIMLISNMLVLFLKSSQKKEINAGWWLVFFILAIYALSYFGSFGLYAAIPFPEDTLIAAIMILAFYFWAVYSGFRTEAIEEIIEETKEVG